MNHLRVNPIPPYSNIVKRASSYNRFWFFSFTKNVSFSDHFFFKLHSGSRKLSGSFISPLLSPGACFISSKDSRENLVFWREVGVGVGVTGGRTDAPEGSETASPLNAVVPEEILSYKNLECFLKINLYNFRF